MPSTTTSLILGAATRISPSLVRPFVESLRRTSYEGRLGLIFGQYGAQEESELRAMADFAIGVDDRYIVVPRRILSLLESIRNTRRIRRAYPQIFSLSSRARGTARSREVRESLEYWLEGLQSLRYRHYYEILTTEAANADQILLTDLRDVLFQDDPFGSPLHGLEVFLEDRSLRIASDPHNNRWIRQLYGDDTLAELGELVVSCSGTIAGGRVEILRYLQAMVEAIDDLTHPLGSRDQAVHNYLLRRGALPDASIISNEHGRVMTLGAMTYIAVSPDGSVINSDGSVTPVLHQYDRHPGFAKQLLSKLAPCASGAASSRF